VTKREKLDEHTKRQLAAFVTLLGLMQSASRLSEELDELAGGIGGSLEDIMKIAGIPFFDAHNAYTRNIRRPTGKGNVGVVRGGGRRKKTTPKSQQ
jgi:hypothetical protein